MESISIPIHIIQTLLHKFTANNESDSGDRNSNHDNGGGCFLLYHKLPPATIIEQQQQQQDDHDHDENKNQTLLLIFDTIIPILPILTPTIKASSSKTTNDNNDDQKGREEKEKEKENIQHDKNNIKNNIIKLHPLLEEFMILSADAIEYNRDDGNDNGDCNEDHGDSIDMNTDEVSFTSSTSSSIPVWIQHTQPPDFYTDSNFLEFATNEKKNEHEKYTNDNNDGNKKNIGHNNKDTDNRPHDYYSTTILDCNISTKMFHLKRESIVYDLTNTTTMNIHDSIDGYSGGTTKYKIEMKLEFIYCTDEDYEQWFVEMGKQQPEQQQQKQQQQQEKQLMYQYLHQVLCQAFEHKIVKKLMILPIILPPFPNPWGNSDGLNGFASKTDSYNRSGGFAAMNTKEEDPYNCQEEAIIVAFFKLQSINIKIKHKNDNEEEEKGEQSSIHDNDDIVFDDGFQPHNYDHMNTAMPNTVLSRNFDDACFRIGTIAQGIDMNSDGNNEIDDVMNNFLSIQITLPSSVENDIGDDDNNGDGPNVIQHTDHHHRQQPLNMKDDNDKDSYCPGYEKLVNEIITLANIQVESASPTGILVTGCAGVGKSTLASAVVRILEKTPSLINMISAKDLLLQASSSVIDMNSLKKMILGTNSRTITNQSKQQKRQILVIDDLDVLIDISGNENDTAALLFDEKRAVLHAILESIDEKVRERKKGHNNLDGLMSKAEDPTSNYLPMILGICCFDSLEIPSTFNRIGRFEKIITMPPPSEIQRREILRSMINQLPIMTNYNEESACDHAKETRNQIRTWSTALARVTAGCVSSDLKRICIDALTMSKARNSNEKSSHGDNLALYTVEGNEGVKWEDLREATRSCIPSQLAHLDVSIPRDEIEHLDVSNFVDKRGTEEWFQDCWQSFGGYEKIKADLYRTVFRPWCRRHHYTSDNSPMSKLEREVPPPTGILFHGSSGTGKTFAADCLARSLGLNVIKVRASDVLDKWLGGSEAAIRAIFSRSRAAAPCLLLFDELDALATNREDEDDGSSELYSRLLSTLLNEMDGVNNAGGSNNVLVVGTTNRIHAIDAALLRPGRFEKHVLLQKPAVSDVKDILKIFLSKTPLSDDVNLVEVSELLHELGANGADIRGICTESCLLAIRDIDAITNLDDMFVRMKDFNEAICLWKK